MSFRVDQVTLETAREQGCVQQLLTNTSFGFAYGLACSLVIFTFRAPSARELWHKFST